MSFYRSVVRFAFPSSDTVRVWRHTSNGSLSIKINAKHFRECALAQNLANFGDRGSPQTRKGGTTTHSSWGAAPGQKKVTSRCQVFIIILSIKKWLICQIEAFIYTNFIRLFISVEIGSVLGLMQNMIRLFAEHLVNVTSLWNA